MQYESLNVLWEKIEKNMVCFDLTFTVFYIVLSARRSSAVLLYSLGKPKSALSDVVKEDKKWCCHARSSACVNRQ